MNVLASIDKENRSESRPIDNETWSIFLRSYSDYGVPERSNGASSMRINEISSKLGIKFDDDYIRYLNEIGYMNYKESVACGSGEGVVHGNNDEYSVVESTMKMRRNDNYNNLHPNAVFLNMEGSSDYIIYIMNLGVYTWYGKSMYIVSIDLPSYLNSLSRVHH
jgi:hypothetical protein